MTFGRPHHVYLFFLLIPVIILFLTGNRRRQKALESFARKELLKELLPAFDRKKSWIKAVLIGLALVLCILALMRPQGGILEEKEKRRGLDILIAIDTSKSMLAEDVKPNRLDLAKTVVRDVAAKMKGDRIGLIAFSGTAFLLCPLTVDYSAFMLSLESLDVNAIPRGGTSLSGAIGEAVKGFTGTHSKAGVLLMITDGEDQEGDPVNAAVQAKNDGITIFTLGVGTVEGDLITSTDETGRRSFVMDKQGNVVKSRLNEATLRQVASSAGGQYIRVTGLNDALPDMVGGWFSKMEQREIEGGTRKLYREWFQLPLILALLLLIGEALLGERKKEG